MNFVKNLKTKVLNGYKITKEEAIILYNSDLDELSTSANEIRKHFCGNKFDICTIINAKSGRCSENCKYCAQSAHFDTNCEVYPLLSEDEIIDGAINNEKNSILRYSLVTSGRNLDDDEIDYICNVVEKMKKTVSIEVCGSFGLLNKEQYAKLYNSGLARIHNNLETSRNYFPSMCTTHTFDDKLNSIKQALSENMSVCSGAIFGIGESVVDRIDLAFSLAMLNIKSVPVNLLSPIKGTPCENNTPVSEDEFLRIVCVYRFILPDAFIRLAGGRGMLSDKGRACFMSGANAAISGDMLTTSGISIKTDLEMIYELGFEIPTPKLSILSY